MDIPLSQPEFIVPMFAPLKLHPQMSNDSLPPKQSLYWLAGYVSETSESISYLSVGGFTEEDRELSDELTTMD